MVKSISASTIKQYQNPLQLWSAFAEENQLNIFKTKPSDIITFLTKRFKEGASYGTLNSTRSAIALVSAGNIHKDGLISRFLKGIFKERPPKPKYSTTWDTSPVLKYMAAIHPLKNFKLKEVSEELATLLALTTAHRLQTLALIQVDNIVITDSSINIKIPDRIKTSGVNSFQPELTLPFFKENPSLCVASAVLEYLEITKDLRSEKNSKLLISTVKPHRNASAQTLGHWIKSMLFKAGINTNHFTAYSTRHAAVLAAHKAGIDIDTIRRTAGWSANSQMFAKVYNRPIVFAKDNFAQSILKKIR